MPRRLRLWLDPFAALQALRALVAARTGGAGAVLTSWLGRAARRRGRRSEPDPRAEKAALELRPLDLRNPPSETIGAAALPLAATATAAAAALYFAARADAYEAAVAAAERVAGGAYDAAPAPVAALGLDDGGFPARFGRVEDQLDPGGVPTGGSDPGEAVHPAHAVDGDGSTLGPAFKPEDPLPYGGGSNLNVGGASGLTTDAEGGGPGTGLPSLTPSTAAPGAGSAAGGVLPAGVAGAGGGAASATAAAAPSGSAPATDATVPGAAGATRAAATPVLLADSSQQPVAFVQNAGQWAAGTDFRTNGSAFQVAVNAGGETVHLNAAPTAASQGGAGADTVQIAWSGTNSGVTAQGRGALAAVSNYFTGSDPSQWHADVPEYAGVEYAGLWDGVNLVYHGAATAGGVEYDFDVQPGAAAAAIGFTVSGGTAWVDDQGRLVVTTPSGAELDQAAPVLYQVAADGSHRIVSGGYQVRADGSIGFAVGAYDPTRELVIDPVLNYAYTTSAANAYGVVADAAGNAYVVGSATNAGVQDAYVTKIGPTGSAVWTTYLGGSTSSSGQGVALGADGSVYATGSTQASNFTTTAGAYQTTSGGGTDAFVTKLTPAGAVSYSSYLGGAGADSGLGVGVDTATGQAVVVGSTASASTTFPLVSAAQGTRASSVSDGFVARFNAAGSGLVFSTFLGTSGSSAEQANGVAVDSAGYALVVGAVTGGGALSGRYAPTGARGALSAGGTTAVAVDGQDRVYETGSGFTGRYDQWTGAAVYSAAAGGNGVAGTAAGQAVVAGASGGVLAVTEYATTGAALWSATYSGSAAGYAAAVDPQGNIYVAGAGGVVLKYGLPPAPVATALDGVAATLTHLTRDTAPTVTGTAPGSSTVSVYLTSAASGLTSLLGTTTASSGGLWTYTLATISAGDGTYRLAATDTVSGAASPASTPVTFTLDTTAPTVALAVATLTYDTEPEIDVTATDLNGFAAGATVVLDEAVNGGAWTTGYATGTLVNGAAVFTGYTPLPVGTLVDLRVRALDAAGNQGTSATAVVTVAASPTTWATGSVTSSSGSGYGGTPTATTPPDALGYAGDATVTVPLALTANPALTAGPAPGLVYDSQEASPAPIVQVTVQSNNALSAVPSSVIGTLTWDGTVAGTMTYNVSQLSPGSTWVFAAAGPVGAATGRHTYTLALAINNGTGGTVNTSASGALFVVNRSNSPYGAGWGYSGTDALVTIAASGSYPAGVLRLYGTGGWAFYASNGTGGYVSPAGDPGTLATSGSGWKYTAYDGTSETFDSSGRETAWASADGTQTVTYTYSGSGSGTAAQVATVANPDGSVATFSYSSGALATVQAVGSRTTTFTVSSGNLVSVTDPSGVGSTFAYSSHDLTGETAAGATTAWTYSNGLVQTVQSGSLPVGTVTAGVSAGLGTAAKAGVTGGVGGSSTDALGNVSRQWYNSQGQPVRVWEPTGGVVSATYNANGFLTTVTDELGQTTTYTVNAAGQDTAVMQPDGAVGTYVYGGANGALTRYTDPLGNVTTYTNDSFGRRTSVTDPMGDTTTYAYGTNGLVQTATDPDGHVTTYSYDTSLRLIGTQVGGQVTGTTGYDARGDAVTFTDALGNVATTSFDLAGRVTGTVDPLGDRTTSVYSATTGLLLSASDPDGNVTSYGYDAEARRVAVIAAFGTSLAAATTTVYDANNNVIATVDPVGNRTSYAYRAAPSPSVFAAQIAPEFDGMSVPQVVATVDALGNATTNVYNTHAERIATIDPLGRVTRYGFDTRSRQVTVTDPLNEVSTAAYDADSNVTATIDPLGHATTSVFDKANRLIATVDPAGDRTSYGYDAASNLTTTTDPLGHTTTSGYNAQNLAVTVTDPLGHTTTTGYDADLRAVTVTDPLGHTTTTIYDAASRRVATEDALGHFTTAVYDAASNQIATADPNGHVTTGVFDALNRRVATVDSLGDRATTGYDASDNATSVTDPLGHVTTNVYDADKRLVATEDALGNFATTTYDPAGNTIATETALGQFTTHTVDGLNRVIATTDALGNITSVGFDKAGNRTTTTDPRGSVTTNVYDAANRLIASVDPLGDRTSYGYDAASNAITTTDPLGHVTTRVYDAANRLIASVDPLGDRTSYGYDAASNATTTTDPLGHVSTRVYDAANRVSAAEDALGNFTTTSYDAAGNIKTTVDPRGDITTYGYNADNERVTTTDALGNVWVTQYNAVGLAWRHVDPNGNDTRTYFDADNRAIQTADALGDRQNTAYDGDSNVVATADSLGDTTTSVYDGANRLTVTINALGSRTTYGYDVGGNTVSLTDPDGNMTTWAYDAGNRVSSETIPTTQTLLNDPTYTYDADGRETSTTDEDGRRTDFTYDANGRKLTEKWYASGGALVQTLTYTYDAFGNMLTAQAPAGGYTFSYDADNRVSGVQEPFALTLTFGFDTAGNRTSVKDSQGGVTTVAFDALNRQTSEQLGGTGITGVQDTRAYDAAGRRVTDTRQTLVSGSWVTAGTTSYAYDAANREQSITNLTGAGAVLSSYVYAYDSDSRVSSQTANGVVTTYTYDGTSQLLSAGGVAYGYDANGNRNTTGYATGSDNETTTDGTSTYTYDAVGNVVQSTVGASGATWVYTYNNRNELVGASYSATRGGAVTQMVTYVYDAFGNKIEEDVWSGSSTTVTRYGIDAWDPAQPAPVGNENANDWADLNSSNVLTTRRLFGPGVDELTVREDSSGNVGWYLTDHLGNVVGVTNGSGTLLTAISYDALGDVVSNSTPSQSDRYLKAGSQYDSALSLWQNDVRITNGKFWYQQDPMGFSAGDVNLYRTVGNDFTNASDPSGLASTQVSFGGVIDKYLSENKINFPQMPNLITNGKLDIDAFKKWLLQQVGWAKQTVSALLTTPAKLFNYLALETARQSLSSVSVSVTDDSNGRFVVPKGADEPKITISKSGQTSGKLDLAGLFPGGKLLQEFANLFPTAVFTKLAKLKSISFDITLDPSFINIDLKNIPNSGTIRLNWKMVAGVGTEVETTLNGFVDVPIKAGNNSVYDPITGKIGPLPVPGPPAKFGPPTDGSGNPVMPVPLPIPGQPAPKPPIQGQPPAMPAPKPPIQGQPPAMPTPKPPIQGTKPD